MAIHVERSPLQQLLRDGAQLINVLPTREYEAEHIPGAINIPLKSLTREAHGSPKS